MISKELLRGSLKTMVLHMLKTQGKMYGYEITQYVRTKTADGILLTEGALYPILHKMEAEGLLRAERIRVDNRTRKYYALTPKGLRVAERKTAEFHQYVRLMRLILGSQPPNAYS